VIKSFHDIRTPDDIPHWLAHLDQKWPERTVVMEHICQQVEALPYATGQVVELGVGPGQLGQALLDRLPQASFTGLDSSELLLEFAREILAPFGQRAKLVYADLAEESWLSRLPTGVAAIVSMQSLHDIGGEAEIDRIYSLARQRLAPGGLLLNADLIVPQFNPDKPGRLTIARHLALLQNHGYRAVTCTLEVGEFGCIAGVAP
jgi:hypothetical protein